jgi:hypothetical protein
MDILPFTTHKAVIVLYMMTQKTGTFEKPNKNCRNPKKKIIDRN